MSHPPMQDMIPFYLNGTLPDAQRRQFEQALQQQPDLQIELEQWRVLADAVYHNALDRSKKLPPVSTGLVEALTAGNGTSTPIDYGDIYPDVPIPPPPAQAVPFTLLAQPVESSESAPAQGDSGRRITNVVGGVLTLAAAAAIVLVVGLLLVAMNLGANEDSTAIAAAQVTEEARIASTDEVSVVTEEAGNADAQAQATATPRPLATVTRVQPPTAIIPPTMTNIPPTSTIVPPTITPDRPQGGGAAESSLAAAESSAVQSQSGNCYVQRAEGVPRLPIYQFADKNADVIGALLAGERLDTWVQTETETGAFYQVFLPDSRIRLGWVDANEIDLFGPGGSTCSGLVNPTPTDPASVANLPTAIADSSVCRVSSATGDAVAILASPEAGSTVLGNLPFGDLALARETYSDGDMTWYEVILPGVTSGWMAGDELILNGNCAALPERTDPNAEPAVPYSNTLCRITVLTTGEVPLRRMPDTTSPIDYRLDNGTLDGGQFFVTRQTTDREWSHVTELAGGVYQQRGWNQTSSFVTEGACSNIYAIDAADVASTEMPLMSPTPPAQSE